MMQMSAVGLGSGADQVSDAGIWESNTEGPLAAMLYAAAKNDLGMDWVPSRRVRLLGQRDSGSHIGRAVRVRGGR